MEHHVLRDWMLCFGLVLIAYSGLVFGLFINQQRRIWLQQRAMRRAFEASKRASDIP